MLENKEQEKIAGIISDFFDGQVTEADIDILALKIYENAFKDPKWQKLKEFIKTNIENDEQEYDESKMPMFAHYLSVERFIINKMQELEGEDVED